MGARDVKWKKQFVGQVFWIPFISCFILKPFLPSPFWCLPFPCALLPLLCVSPVSRCLPCPCVFNPCASLHSLPNCLVFLFLFLNIPALLTPELPSVWPSLCFLDLRLFVYPFLIPLLVGQLTFWSTACLTGFVSASPIVPLPGTVHYNNPFDLTESHSPSESTLTC